MHAPQALPTSIRTGSPATARATHASPTQPSYLSLQRRSVRTQWTLGRSGLTLNRTPSATTWVASSIPQSLRSERLIMSSWIQWNYGTAGNQVQAQSLIVAMKATGFNFGIYSTHGVRAIVGRMHSIFIHAHSTPGMGNPLRVDELRARQRRTALVCHLQQCRGAMLHCLPERRMFTGIYAFPCRRLPWAHRSAGKLCPGLLMIGSSIDSHFLKVDHSRGPPIHRCVGLRSIRPQRFCSLSES